MSGTTKISLNIDADLLAEIDAATDASPIKSRTFHIISLIKDGLEARESQARNEHLTELVQLKTLFMLRQLVSSRGTQVLKQLDEQFKAELPEMKHLILENGIDYENL